MPKKRYSTVSEMVRDLAKDSQFAKDTESRIARRAIIKKLIAMRAAKGLSQSDIAARMECTQSRISKLESGEDSELRIGDLYGYLSAFDLEMSVLVSRRGTTIVESIKHHWRCLTRLLGDLQRIATETKDDPTINKAMAAFAEEMSLNYLNTIFRFLDSLPATVKRAAEHFGVIEVIDEEFADSDPEEPLSANGHCAAPA